MLQKDFSPDGCRFVAGKGQCPFDPDRIETLDRRRFISDYILKECR